jgi:hypothetical protein
MARPRTQLSASTNATIESMAATGGTAETITKALKARGVRGISRATVGRRLRELRGKVRVGRVGAKQSAPPPPPESETADIDLPASPEEIPDGLSLDVLRALFRKADRAASEALSRKDLATFGAMGRLVTALSEAIRKATPPEKVDPNDHPDMLSAAKRAREKLHRLVDQAVGCD